MTPYLNLSGDSNVLAYSIAIGSITVEFRTGSTRFYEYTDQSAGAAAVKEMQQLARQGRGLNAFISTTVRLGYARKW